MIEELFVLHKTDTWYLVFGIWYLVFGISIKQYKAKLVAKGFSQQYDCEVVYQVTYVFSFWLANS